MLERIPIAFLAGIVSVVSPCVLPLVPGYLAAISNVAPDQLDDRAMTRRVVLATLPFILGFTIVFVVVGAGAATLAGVLDRSDQMLVAGFLLVVFGLAFAGLLPWPERMLGAGLVAGARNRQSALLLGGAFAVAAAPCVGAVLGSILVLAGDSGSVVRGVVLLTFYAAGLGVAFLLAGIAFSKAMGAFRWVRDRYTYLRVAGGVTLVAFGLLLFFERDWWLYVLLNRAFERLGIESV